MGLFRTLPDLRLDNIYNHLLLFYCQTQRDAFDNSQNERGIQTKVFTLFDLQTHNPILVIGPSEVKTLDCHWEIYRVSVNFLPDKSSGCFIFDVCMLLCSGTAHFGGLPDAGSAPIGAERRGVEWSGLTRDIAWRGGAGRGVTQIRSVKRGAARFGSGSGRSSRK